VRRVGLALGLPEDVVYRQPFPGPGLSVRVIGEVTKERLEILRAADWIVMNEIKRANLYRQLWQSFAVLTNVQSVGVMGDYRTYGYLVAVRAVTSEDAMTADWARIPYDVLGQISIALSEKCRRERVVFDLVEAAGHYRVGVKGAITMSYGNGEMSEAEEKEFDLEMLREDLVGELNAINQYQAHIETLENEDAIRVLEHIRDDEKEHMVTKLIQKLDAAQAAKFEGACSLWAVTAQAE
jgi:hypothetical protein